MTCSADSAQHERDLVLALSGGVGGAKLALGLARVVPAGKLIVVANTGDDFEHLGLCVSPDIDTLLYTLAGVENPATGWGRRDETWSFMAALETLGGETWFRLGDKDLAMHVERTQRLAAGERLTAVTADFCKRLRCAARIVPMSDEPVRTRVRTATGWLDFQRYFVEQRCAPAVLELDFNGVSAARPPPDILAALADPRLRAVVMCPSNPLISIDPILAVPGIRDALRRCTAPIVGVAPLIGGQAVKGPTAKMMAELKLEVSAVAVARRYADLLDAYVVDHADAAAAAALDLPTTATRALMVTLEDRVNLANVALAAADHSGPAGKNRARDSTRSS